MEQHELASPPNKKSNHGLARIRRRVRGILSASKLLCVASYALHFWLSLFRPDFVVDAFRVPRRAAAELPFAYTPPR